MERNERPVTKTNEGIAKDVSEIDVFSPKLGRSVRVRLGETEGAIQALNIGLGPGNWY
jgi:hypothetical protein